MQNDDNDNRSARARRVTRTDVARHAGVSAAAVSYVINGSNKISPATEARIRASIDALAYRPSAIARALSTGSAHLIGMVLPDLTNPFFSEMSEKVEVEAKKRGFSLIVTNSLRSGDVERANIADLEGRQVDAIIVATVLHPTELATPRERRVREVYIEHSDIIEGVSRVGTDLHEGAAIATRHLLDHGHETVAIVGGDVDDPTHIDARVTAWADVISAAGLPPGRIIRSDFTRRGAWEAMTSVIAAGDVPTAVFATSDQQALGVLRACHEAGLRVPEDVAVVGFDGTEEAEFSWPPLTTVRQDIEGIARALVDAAIAPSNTPTRVVLPPELIVRASCGSDH